MSKLILSSQAAVAAGIISASGLCFILASPKALLYAVAGLLLFASPGLVLGLALFGRESYRCPEWPLFGSVLGIGLSGYTAITIGYLVRWSPGLIFIAILTLTAACSLVARVFWHCPLLPAPRRWQRWELALFGGIVAVLALFIAVPFLNVGKLTPFGYAYTWLFGYDFLVRGEYITAMTTAFPPHCMPLAGEPLNMYLVAYALPAFVYTAGDKAISLHSIVQLITFSVSILFYGTLLSVLRMFIPHRKALISTGVVCMVSYSYYWTVSIAKYILLQPGQSTELHRIGLKLAEYGYVSHLFTPLVLVELPALLALSLLFLLLFVSDLVSYRIKRYSLALLCGAILGILFGIDGSLSLGVILWFGLLYLIRLVKDRSYQIEPFLHFVTVVLSCSAIAASFFLLGMYHLKSANAIQFSPYLWFVKFAAVYLPLEFGPLFLLGLWGFVLCWKRNRSGIPMALALLAAIALLQVAFVQMSVLPRLRMVDRILPLVLLVGVGYLFRELYQFGTSRGKLYIAWGVAAMALPTVVTDIYFASNVKDVNETHYVRKVDREACDWIHRSLPQAAVVQGEPAYIGHVGGHNDRQELFVSLIADFAERPQALGWPYIASELVPNGEDIVRERRRDLQTMLSASQADTILTVARKYGITHIYVGPYEQSLHPGLLSMLAGASQGFEEVYSASGVHIFSVRGDNRRELARLPQG